MPVNSRLDLKFFYCPLFYPRSVKEDSNLFQNFHQKSCWTNHRGMFYYNTKMSKLSNGIIKLGLVKSLGLYCNLIPNISQKSKLKLVGGFQINFLCIYLDQVNHLKDFKGSIQKILEFHLPYLTYSQFRNALQKQAKG